MENFPPPPPLQGPFPRAIPSLPVLHFPTTTQAFQPLHGRAVYTTPNISTFPRHSSTVYSLPRASTLPAHSSAMYTAPQTNTFTVHSSGVLTLSHIGVIPYSCTYNFYPFPTLPIQQEDNTIRFQQMQQRHSRPVHSERLPATRTSRTTGMPLPRKRHSSAGTFTTPSVTNFGIDLSRSSSPGPSRASSGQEFERRRAAGGQDARYVTQIIHSLVNNCDTFVRCRFSLESFRTLFVP